MRKLLLLVAITSALFARGQSATNALTGSLLCGEAVMRISHVPEGYHTKGFVKKEIKSDSVLQKLTISYYFSSAPGKEIVTDSTVLNSYLPKIKAELPHFNFQQWTLNEYFFLDETPKDSLTNLVAFPYAACHSLKESCQKVTIYRKSLRQICPSYRNVPIQRSFYHRGDTLVAKFADSLIFQKYVCLAIGWVKHLDSVVVPVVGTPTIQIAYHNVLFYDKKLSCFPLPCSDSTFQTGYVGTVNVRSCDILDNAFTGSLVCKERIKRITVIPVAYRPINLVKKEITSDTGSYSLTISFHFQSKLGLGQIRDTSDVTDYLHRRVPTIYPNWTLSWKVKELFYVDGVLVDSVINTRGYPYQMCTSVKHDCETITVYRKRLEPICPSYMLVPQHYYSYIDNELTVYFKDSVAAVPVCYALGWRIKTDSVKVVIKPSRSESLTVKAIQLEPEPILLTEKTIDMVPCSVDGLEQIEVEKLLVYPNPASGIVYLTKGEKSIRLIDQYGNQHLRTRIDNGGYSLEGLVPGVYALIYTIEGKSHSERLVIF